MAMHAQLHKQPHSTDLLTGVAEAARRLLAIADFDASVNGALEAIATSSEIDRIFILQHHAAKSTVPELATCPYEWTAPGVPLHREVLGRFPMVYSEIEGFSEWLESLKAGEPVQKLKREMSAKGQAIQDIDRALSVLTVPIFVDREYWGNFGFDDCTTERVWSDAEIAVLQTAAATFAAALQRRENAAELESHNQVLARRDRILQATATASNVLLNGDDFDASVSEALEILGKSLGFDRIAVAQQFDDPTGESSGFIRFLYEWDGPGISTQLEDYEDMSDFHWDEMGMGRWYEASIRGEAFGQLFEDLPEPFRTIQQLVDVKSTHNIPIFVEGQFWGVFGIDHCREKKLLAEVELVALKTAANCVGGAIARDRSRKEREAAARERAAELEANNQALAERDRILEATAAAANVMLTDEDFGSAVNKALKIVGEGLDVDRAGLMAHFDRTDDSPGYHQQMYEWDASGISAQIDHPELVRVSDEGIEFAVEQLARGEVFGGIVEELAEPFRTGQQEMGAQSVYAIPIFVERRYWGIVALDDCRHKTRRSEAELEALMTLANCVGSAIEQEQVRQARAAETEAHNQALAERDRILEATAAAANVMLVNDDFESAVNEALQIVGEGLDVDRVNLGKHYETASSGDTSCHHLLYEWNTADTITQATHPELSKISDDGMESAIEALMKGKVFGGIIDELPEPFRSSQIALGVKSTYAVPVNVAGQYWGLIGFDDCHKQTRRSESELEALKTLANCIGSAIERDRIRQAREAAERTAIVERERAARAAELEAANKVLTTRDRWLETTAAAANELLSAIDIEASVSAALATIGENLECDRLSVMRYQPNHKSHPLGAMATLYEWDAEGIRPQIEDAELRTIPATGVEDWFTHFLAGECIGGNVSELAEPARSGQESLGVLSTYAVPIFIDEALWGIVGMDYCREERWLGDSELAVFKTAATCIGSAIYQAQVRRDKAAQERAAELAKTNEAVRQTLNALITTPDLDQFLGTILTKIVEQVQAACAYLFLYDEPTHTLHTHLVVRGDKVYQGNAPDDPEILRHSIPADITPFWQVLVNSNAPFTLDENNPDSVELFWPTTVEWHESLGHKSSTCICLKLSNKPIGYIGFAFTQYTLLTNEQLEFIQALTNQATLAIHLTRLAEEAKQAAVLQEQEKAAQARAAKLAKTNEAIAQTLTTLTEAPELDEFLGQVLIEISAPIGACKAHLFLYDESTHTLHQHITVQDGQTYKDAAPSDPELFRHPIPADLSDGWQIITESEKPFTMDERNPAAADVYWPGTIPWHQAQGHLSATCACMRVGNKPVGFIGFAFRHLPVLTDEQLEFIQALTNQATLAIQLTRLAEEVKQNAILQEQERAAQARAAQLSRSNQALKRSLDLLAQQPELEAFLQGVVNEAVAQTRADSGQLFLYDAATHTCSLRVSTDNNGDWRSIPDMKLWLQPCPVDEAPAFWARIFERKAFVVEDLPNTLKPGPHIWEPSINWHLQRGHSSFICAPLLLGDQAIGFLGLPFVDEPNITQEDIELAQALTNQATLAIQFTRLAEDAKQSALSVALIEERNRLAREIHDTLAQAFTGISLQLEAAKDIFTDSLQTDDAENALYHINRAGSLARQGLSEARRSVHALRSAALTTDSLPSALRTALAEMTQDSPTAAEVRVMGIPYSLAEDLKTNLLRIGQEATTNTLRHAEADTLTLTLTYAPTHIRMNISDNGKGCTVSLENVEGFGLVGMRERVLRFDGKFSLKSQPGQGTVIDIAIPVNS